MWWERLKTSKTMHHKVLQESGEGCEGCKGSPSRVRAGARTTTASICSLHSLHRRLVAKNNGDKIKGRVLPARGGGLMARAH